jgi:hypothetical protein
MLVICISIVISSLVYRRGNIKVPFMAVVPIPSIFDTSACNSSLVTILSIDGGGIRGIIPAYFLNVIEQETQLRTAHLFDFLVGVSTGSILASGLTVPDKNGEPKYSANDMLNIYKNDAKAVFTASLTHKIMTLSGLLGPKFQSSGMQHLTASYFGNIEMVDLLSHVILFGYDVKNKGLIAFSNSKFQTKNMPYYKVRDVVDGATAIMSYFASKSLYDTNKQLRHMIADATLVLNNPTAMSFLYALKQCPRAPHFLIISLGTGHLPMVDIEPEHWGLINWLPDMLTTTVEGESATADITTEKFVTILNESRVTPEPKVLFVRINPNITWEDADPVDASAAHLSNLEKIGSTYYENNKKSFQCVAKILRERKMVDEDDECYTLLIKNEHPKAPIYLDLVGTY